MLKQLNIKREYILIAASIIMLWLAYQLAFKRTVEAWQLHSELKKQITQSTDLGYQPGYLERKSVNLDKLLGLYKADTSNYRSNIISSISSVAEGQNVKLSGVPSQDPTYHSSQFIIQKLDFEGDFFSLLKTLNHLQATPHTGVIRSAIFKMPNAHGQNNEPKNLILEVCFQITGR